jgi:glycosyltransferase involved in cell wall biosynthesis
MHKFEKADDPFWVRSLPIYMNGQNHLHFYKSLSKEILEFRPDILNVEEEPYSVVTAQCFRIASKLGAKKLFFGWQNILKTYPLPFRMIEQYVFKNADMAFFGSQAAVEVFQTKGYRGRAEVVPQIGIDTKMFNVDGDIEVEKKLLKMKLNLEPDDFLILSAGRVVEEKGVQVLLKALNYISHSRIKVCVVGSGPYLDTLKHIVTSQVREPARVRFVGAVPSHEMPLYTRAADVMCLASLTMSNWKEQGPTRVVTESMAAGAIVVVSDSAELPHVVGDAGLVFPENDEKKLASTIDRLAREPHLRSHLRVKALQRVKDCFSAEIIAKKNAEAFISLCGAQ